MANYESLIGTINAYIKRNGRGAITGDILNGVMRAVVDSLGKGYQFMGILTPQTEVGSADVRQFYLAGAGTYDNFGDEVIIPDGALGIFTYDEGWSAGVLQIGSGGGGGTENAVLYVAQTLDSGQKSQARSNIGAGTYSKPIGGIPSTDLASAVTTSLGKADSAVQMSDLLALAETWTFTLDDDSVVTKKIIVLPTA